MIDRLHRLAAEEGQSPWLDNLRRDWLSDGTLAARVEQGVRGVTSNPSIFQKAITASDAYDAQFRDLTGAGLAPVDSYWRLVCDDISAACSLLAPLHRATAGADGFVSLEVAPSLAHDSEATVAAALDLAATIGRPNLMVKIPGTEAGLPAVRTVLAAGVNVNVTLLFSVERYRDVLAAHTAGLEDLRRAGGDVSQVSSVASFFVSRVDTEIDRRLQAVGTADAMALRGRAAVANARMAYQVFLAHSASDRWADLVEAGARPQRPLWASTSTKDESYPDTLYVDSLIGPDTVNTLPDATLDAFVDHGTVARTVDIDVGEAAGVIARLGELGIDVEEVAGLLEDEGVGAFEKSFDELLTSLADKAVALASR